MKKDFTKADLKTGDIIVTRDGLTGLVLIEKNIIIYQESGYDDLDVYKDDLASEEDFNYDIVRVYRGWNDSPISFSDYEDEAEMIFEREYSEPIEEDTVCEAKPQPAESKPAEENAKGELIRVIIQGFYGNRTATDVREENVDRLILGYVGGSEFPVTEPIDRTIVPIPGYDNLVLVYNRFQEEEQRLKNKRWLEEDGYEAKPLAFIPEEGIEIYSRCLVCRINDGRLESLQPEDFQPGFMKYLAR